MKCLKYFQHFSKVLIARKYKYYIPFIKKCAFYSNKGFENNVKKYDIVISGGGLVGNAMACALGTSKFLAHKKVLVLEQSPQKSFDVPPDYFTNRVFSLTPATRCLFEELDVWEKMTELRIKPVKKLQIWEECSEASLDFSQDPTLEPDVAYIAESVVIQKVLADRLASLPDLEVLFSTSIDDVILPSKEKVDSDRDLVHLTLSDGTHLETKLLIGAEGINSVVRRAMGVDYLSWNYHQRAVVATLKLSEPTENNVAWQKFLSTGPIALLPLDDQTSSLVWSLPTDRAKQLEAMSEEAFVDVLNSSLWDQQEISSIVQASNSAVRSLLHLLSSDSGQMMQCPPGILSLQPGSRASFPLSLGHAADYVACRTVLIGDAAHKIHPMAGLGLNLGFGDVSALVRQLEKSSQIGEDVGCLAPLLEYETERQRQVCPTMAALTGLHYLYQMKFPLVVAARSVGWQILNSPLAEPLKRKVVDFASS